MPRAEPQLPDPLPDPSFDPWNFRPEVAAKVRGGRLAGHKVEAIDGRAGTVVDASLAAGASYLVISTGRWPFGRQAQLPAGTASHLDPAERRIYVDRTRGQIKAAPQVRPEAYDDPGHRSALARYYEATYHTPLHR